METAQQQAYKKQVEEPQQNYRRDETHRPNEVYRCIVTKKYYGKGTEQRIKRFITDPFQIGGFIGDGLSIEGAIEHILIGQKDQLSQSQYDIQEALIKRRIDYANAVIEEQSKTLPYERQIPRHNLESIRETAQARHYMKQQRIAKKARKRHPVLRKDQLPQYAHLLR
jgi:hypothetical protein